MGWGLDLIKATMMAGSFYGYPFLKIPLINKYFALGGKQVKLRETFEKTNCLKMPKQNKNNDMFLWPMYSTYSDCLIISRFQSPFSSRKVLVTYVSHTNCIKQLTVFLSSRKIHIPSNDFDKAKGENVTKTTPDVSCYIWSSRATCT